VTAALDRSEAVARFDLSRRGFQVGYSDQYVVELQDAPSVPAPCSATPKL